MLKLTNFIKLKWKNILIAILVSKIPRYLSHLLKCDRKCNFLSTNGKIILFENIFYIVFGLNSRSPPVPIDSLRWFSAAYLGLWRENRPILGLLFYRLKRTEKKLSTNTNLKKFTDRWSRSGGSAAFPARGCSVGCTWRCGGAGGGASRVRGKAGAACGGAAGRRVTLARS